MRISPKASPVRNGARRFTGRLEPAVAAASFGTGSDFSRDGVQWHDAEPAQS
ncbi:hypothetical protein [Streptomyces sp. NP-1717]|uniref:hypothetical protein n=1 Tax=Streptomyces sp. NP-1717 TaxID=2704470 RepID=UPI001F5C3F42|nr:hypothetical protein [Streptomyces sp. NP-1717]MCI3223502.1 hypothetical protein [Streptomyces sp. NP-1717]